MMPLRMFLTLAGGLAALSAASSPVSAQTEVTVLIAYTDDARFWAGGQSQIESQITAAVNEGNTILANSAVDIELSVAAMVELAVDESQYPQTEAGMAALVDDLIAPPANSVFESLHMSRDEYFADLVVLVFENLGPGPTQYGKGNEVCGAALTVCDESFAPSAYAIARRDKIAGPNYVLIHEIGHLMGLRHAHLLQGCVYGSVTTVCPPASHGAFAYGHPFMGPDNNGYIGVEGEEGPLPGAEYGTIMTGFYPGVNLVPYFSNPDLSGPQKKGEEGQSDSAQALNNVKDAIAGFRQEPTAPVIVTSILIPLLLL